MAIDLEAGAGVKLPVGVGVDVTFKGLTHTVPSNTEKGETAYLLKDVSGFFRAGQLVALLGPSGSGKTTLLDILSGRKTSGNTEGEIRFGGRKPSKPFLQRYTGVVEQFDTLIGSLTVHEMLMYTASLKRPLSESLAEKRTAVDSLISTLGLETCRDVQIGDPLRKGISGGQAKRANIGIALVTNPMVLFLDEPTSGLDSFTANEVMSVVRKLADNGTTICATIHSPSAYVFKLFDAVMMLVRGNMVYFGPRGEPAVSYARAYWPAAKSAADGEDVTDAEMLVQLITNADRAGQAKLLADTYQKSELKQENDAALMQLMASTSAASDSGNKHCLLGGKHCKLGWRSSESTTSSSDSGEAGIPTSPADASQAKALSVRSSTTTPVWWQILMLIKYRTSYNLRNPAWLGPRVMDKLVFAFIILTLYLGIGDDFAPDNIVNITSSLFMWTVLPAFGAASYVPSIVLDRRLFVRERADGLYSVFAYLFAKIFEEVSLAACTSVVFSAVVFYAVKYQGSFALFWIVYYITLCNGIVLAYLIAALSPNMDVANAALPVYVTTLLFFAGQLITMSAMPAYWKWYSYLDFVRYSWGALMRNHFSETDPVFTQDGSTVLQYYSLDGINMWDFTGFNAIFFIVFGALALLCLSYVQHQKR